MSSKAADGRDRGPERGVATGGEVEPFGRGLGAGNGSREPDGPTRPVSFAKKGGRRLKAPAVFVARAFLLLLPALSLMSFARAPRLPRPLRAPAEIAAILARGPHQGECERCHTGHGDGRTIVYENALVGPDDNTLCDSCHEGPWVGGSYGGTMLYNGSAHGSSPGTAWPGPNPPPRVEAGAAGKCLNCHDPHGWKDAASDIPALSLAREEALCLACHDGSPASANIRADLSKPFRHPVATYSGRHAGAGEALPSDFAISPLDRRHAECADCHNPHVARAEMGTPGAASKTLLGTSRVEVLNGAAGTPPSYTFVAGSDTSTAATEHSLCFKCHSSWTAQPAGQTDLARALNPNNPSFHPVEAEGRSPTIDPAAFSAGWGPSSLTACSDCHGSDFGTARGPHGSIFRYILKQSYTASSAYRAMTSDEICFRCHSYDVYANRDAPEAVRQASRFNGPNAGQGHAEHVGAQNVSCYSCHATHGSTTLPHLIVTGRSPGIVAYTETEAGGTCSATCHGTRSYLVNYAR